MEEKRFEDFTLAILKLNKLVQRIKLFEMEEYGLKAIHVMCIYYLAANPDGLTSSELSRLTLDDKAAISRALRLLQEKSYISYAATRYNAPIFLSETGKKIAGSIFEKAHRAVNAAGRDLSDEDRQIFYKVLSSVTKNLSDYYEGLRSGSQ